MDPTAVAAHYRGKGYVVRDGVRATGASGKEYRVPLLAEGPLGSLAIFFGDFGGVDGPEMGGARKVARDLGATPVLAADSFSAQDRQVGARLGVVLLDAAALEASATAAAPLGADTGRAWPGLAPQRRRDAAPADDEQHPWPASGRVGGRDGPGTHAVDVDDLLAEPRAAAVVKTAAPMARDASPDLSSTPVAAEAPLLAGGGSTGPGLPSAADAETGEGLWRRPRERAGAQAPRPARTQGTPRFAWLGGEAVRSRPSSTGLAVEYEGVVAAGPSHADPGDGPRGGRRTTAVGSAGEPTEEASRADGPAAGGRLGESIELQPTLLQLEHQERRDRLLRRVFWLLFVLALGSLVLAWWTGSI